MGLLYAFPVSLEEDDFATLQSDKLTLKTYGLPYIFWGYAVAILIVIGFMFLAIKDPILKLVELGDETDAMLGYSLLAFIAALPVILMGFFFYEKRIVRTPGLIALQHRVFGLPVFSEQFQPAKEIPYSIEAFLDSPNVARMKGGEDAAGFQNKGYFVLWLNTADSKRIALDRHSRKADLVKLEELLRKIS